MKFAFATALLAVASAVEVDAEWSNNGYGYGAANSYSNSMGGYGGYRSYGNAARVTIAKSYQPNSYAYNGHGHHSYSAHSSSDYSSYDSMDYSLSDHGYGYRHMNGANRYMRYQPKYNQGRYYYGNRYASNNGMYKGAYRSYGTRSYSACQGACMRPSYNMGAW